MRFDALTSRELDAWHALQAANPALDSPYFHPGFAAAVHATGRTVEVVVGEDARGEVATLLPVHHDRGLLRPAGWPGADFQGPIRAPGGAFPPPALLGGDVHSFAFDHLLDSYAEFEPWVERRAGSPYLDVSGGLDRYLGRASRSARDNMGQARRRAARAEREIGPVRFVAHEADPGIVDQLVELKRMQYAATGKDDYFADPAHRELVKRLLITRSSSFGALLSTVCAGPHLLAAHLGLRAGGVLHWWFPVYDPAFARLSPGWILLREVVAAAPRLGLVRIDLGRGDDEYKRRAKTGESIVTQGIVTSPVRLALRHARRRAVDLARSSPLGPSLQRGLRTLRARRAP